MPLIVRGYNNSYLTPHHPDSPAGGCEWRNRRYRDTVEEMQELLVVNWSLVTGVNAMKVLAITWDSSSEIPSIYALSRGSKQSGNLVLLSRNHGSVIVRNLKN